MTHVIDALVAVESSSAPALPSQFCIATNPPTLARLLTFLQLMLVLPVLELPLKMQSRDMRSLVSGSLPLVLHP